MPPWCRNDLSKFDRDTQKLRHWLFVYILIAVIALAAGYYVFGGANMGH